MAARYPFPGEHTLMSGRDAIWTPLSAVEEWPITALKPGASGFHEIAHPRRLTPGRHHPGPSSHGR
jgi:hypothetical protein